MDQLLKEVGITRELFDKVHLYKEQAFEKPIIEFSSILNYLEFQAKKQTSSIFIIEVKGGQEVQTITYKVFYENLLKVSYILKNVYDITFGKKVAILPENSLTSVYMILATMLCGAVGVIINPNEPMDRIRHQIKKTECLLTISDSFNYVDSLTNVVEGEDILKECRKLCPVPEDSIVHFKPNQPALMVFTTGSTSTSKPVVQMHYNIAINCWALANHHQLNSKQRLLCILPIYHVNGLEFTIFSSMVAGSSVVLCDSFNPEQYFDLIDKYKVTIASLVPPMFDLLLSSDSSAFDLSSLKYFVTAAAPLSSKTSNVVWDKLGKRIIQGYGLTETTNFSALMPIDLTDSDYKFLMLDCDIPSIGQEIFGNEVVILKEDGTFANNGEEGEICMRGHSVMAGYFQNTEDTLNSFKYGWFHSGDMGKIVSLSSRKEKFLKITGRLKNIIKISGHAVSLDEIDRLIIEMERVQDVVTCAVNDDSNGEFPLSFVVKKTNSLTEQDILKVLSKTINHQSLPRAIIFVPQIPRMKNGKINRSQILKDLLNKI